MKSVNKTCQKVLAWTFIATEQAFYSAAFQGMALASILCFIILMISIRNIIQSIIALACVATVITSVLCIEYILGWEVGVAVSFSMVILIGFSVDFVVHLASDFMHQRHHSRHDKMKGAY